MFQQSVGKEKKRRRLGSRRVSLSSDLDQKSFEFLEDERSEGRPITSKQLKASFAGCWGNKALVRVTSGSVGERFCIEHLAKSVERLCRIISTLVMCHSGVPLCGTNAKIGKKTIRGKTTKAEKKGFTVALAATILFEEKNRVLGQRVMSKLSIPNHVCISKQMDDT